MAFALVNCNIYTGDDVLTDRAVLVEGGIISDLPRHGAIPDGVEVKNMDGLSVTAGFIDLQINGGGDVLFNGAPTLETLRVIAASHRRFGVTQWLPTFITGERRLGMLCRRQGQLEESECWAFTLRGPTSVRLEQESTTSV